MKISNLYKSFGNVCVFKNLNLNISDGKITCIMGSSGCGKTTLLNIISGLEKTDCGKITGNSEKISYLFQEPRLLPWKTALENVSLVSDKATATDYLKLLGLDNELNRYPNILSGGQRQRIAIARTLSYESDIILLDEPFQNLDAENKNSIAKVFLNLYKNTEKTVIWVTHDITEAEKISDNIINLDFLKRPAIQPVIR